MTIEDVKVWGVNSLALGISLSGIETLLSILALLVGIGYTAQKWYLLHKSVNK